MDFALVDCHLIIFPVPRPETQVAVFLVVVVCILVEVC
jgi:hypothetical protein